MPSRPRLSAPPSATAAPAALTPSSPWLSPRPPSPTIAAEMLPRARSSLLPAAGKRVGAAPAPAREAEGRPGAGGRSRIKNPQTRPTARATSTMPACLPACLPACASASRKLSIDGKRVQGPSSVMVRTDLHPRHRGAHLDVDPLLSNGRLLVSDGFATWSSDDHGVRPRSTVGHALASLALQFDPLAGHARVGLEHQHPHLAAGDEAAPFVSDVDLPDVRAAPAGERDPGGAQRPVAHAP